jgi:nicotinamide-nucleotide adenylyltransferase
MSEESPAKFSVAFVIGRFQPPHNGHSYLFLQALEHAENMVIGIGSSNEERTADNPLSAEERKKLLIILLTEMNIYSKVLAILEIPDIPDDAEWSTHTVNLLHAAIPEVPDEQVVCIGNNDWVNRLLSEEGFTTITTKFCKREENEGRRIRTAIRNGEDGWKQAVHESVVQHMNDAAQVEAIQNTV